MKSRRCSAALMAALGGFALAPAGEAAMHAPGGGRCRIQYDETGTPHVEAKSVEDVCFGLGWCTARDRLWQLEFLRRSARGEIAELLGPAKARQDFFVRALRFPQNAQSIAEALDPATRPARMLRAYADGINAFLHESGHRLPPELEALCVRPRDWTIADSVAIVFLQGLNLASDLIGQRFQWLEESRRIGAEAVAKKRSRDPAVTYETVGGKASWGGPPIAACVPQGGEDLSEILLAGARTWIPRPTDGPAFASNVWAVSGTRSASGKPLLANDPHLALAIPSFWYRTALSCGEGWSVTGLGVPGVPAIVSGRSDTMAWGVTYQYADSCDLIREKFAPGTHDFVVRNGTRERVMTERPRVRVRIGPFRIPVFWQTLRFTPRGFIVSEDRAAGTAIVVRFSGSHVTRNAMRFLEMPLARSSQEFREALRDLFQPTLNVVYAEADGRIGYQAAGWVPRREKQDRRLPVPADDGGADWAGFVPFDELPHEEDPKRGFLVSANNYPCDPATYPAYYSQATFPHYRAVRIDELLRAKPRLDLSDMAAIQADVLVMDQRLLRRAMLERFAREGQEFQQRDVLVEAARIVSAWDGRATGDGEGIVLWRAWLRTFQRRLEITGLDGATLAYLSGERIEKPRGVRRHGNAASAALAEALERLEALLGPRPWRWENAHRATFRHERTHAGGVPPLLSIGVDGDRETVDVAPSRLPESAEVTAGSSHRMLVDLADPSSLWSALPPGNIGDPGAAVPGGVGDELATWARNQYRQIRHGAFEPQE